MTESTNTPTKATLILVLVAALIIASYYPEWLAKPVKDLIPPGSGIRPDTLSKLKARVMGAFRTAIELATKPGRKPSEPAPEVSSALDDECARIKQVFVEKMKGKKRQAQDYLVEAFARLVARTPITQKLFCEKLGVPDRDFRYWKKRVLEPATPSAPPEPKPEPQPCGQGRFDLEQTLPGIQQMADTTELEVAGTRLKIVAVQDPGNRHRKLWSSYHVDVTENCGIVAEQISKAPDGTQTIHDRGTPFVAEQTRDTLDEKGCEPAPCKEFAATEKSTIERSNRTVKEAIAPLVAFFESLVGAVPALDCPALIATFVQLSLDLFHHGFNLGHRDIPHPLEARDREVLECIAEHQLEKARDGQHSRLSNLERIHAAYGMASGTRAFIKAHRNHALADIIEAEQRLVDAILAGTLIHQMHAYFASILARVATPRIEQRRLERNRRDKLARERESQRKQDAWRDHLECHPVEMLRFGLDIVAQQWRDDHFLFGNVILCLADVESAIASMATSSPLSFHVDLIVEAKRWYLEHDGNKPPLEIVLETIDKLIEDLRRYASKAS